MARHYNPAHRRQAAQWAKSLFARNFYVLDTETTGLGEDAEIVQIGIVDAAGDTLMNQLVKPSHPIPLGATRIHGISDADVVDAPAFMRLYIRLSSLLAGEVVVGYNMDFDWRMLRQNAARYGLPEIRVSKRDCAMKQYAKFHGKRGAGGRGYVWQKLGVAAKHEGIPPEKTHDALHDARLTLALLRVMAESA